MKLAALLFVLSFGVMADYDSYLDCIDYGHPPLSKEKDAECKAKHLPSKNVNESIQKEIQDILATLSKEDAFDVTEICLGMHGPAGTLAEQLECVKNQVDL